MFDGKCQSGGITGSILIARGKSINKGKLSKG